MEHKKKIWLKGILTVALFVMVFITYLSPVFAEINTEYYSTTGATQEDVDAAAKDNTLLSPIGGFVYIIGNIIEWLLSSLSSAATGMNTMPWADMILYNSVAMLDVNFINPNENSLINGMQGIIQKTYFTIFSLAITFFGIAVVIMAIKLAVSSIAEEKAKYKSAITSWLMAVILLFTMHYFMAFVFYLNESVVKLASDIAVNSVSSTDLYLESEGMESLKNIMLHFVKEENKVDWKDHKTTYPADMVEKVFPITVGRRSNGDVEIEEKATEKYDPGLNAVISKMFSMADSNFSKWIYNTDNPNFMVSEKDNGYNNLEVIITLCNSFTNSWGSYPKIRDAHNAYLNYSSQSNKDAYISQVATPISKINFKMSVWDSWFNSWSGDQKLLEKKLNDEDSFFQFSEEYLNYLAIYYNSKSGQNNNTDNENNIYSKSTASLIATYFKSQAWGVNEESLQTTDANVTFCFLYTIFVIQSLLYFFAYIKRFFYIIVLALMAPIVVVYDFVSKI